MKSFLTLFAIIILSVFQALQAQQSTLRLVKDIHPDDEYNPHGLSAFGNMAMFISTDGSHGMEPWISDGTESGTYMLMDIRPGAEDSYKPGTGQLNNYFDDYFRELNGKMIFTADDSLHGHELWITDGTIGGTYMVKDINPGEGESKISYRMFSDNKMFFRANDGGGNAFWVTDGTEAGTLKLSDVKPYEYKSAYINGLLYFSADSSGLGTELWRTDGTVSGTQLVRDIYVGPNDGVVEYITKFGDGFIFTADSATLGREPWLSDGTFEGTTLLKDILPGLSPGSSFTETSLARFYYNYNNQMLFNAKNTNGTELWITDGTTEGTVMLKDINSVPGESSDPFGFYEFNGQVWFKARSPEPGVWTTDGTADGTQEFIQENGENFTEFNGKLYYKAEGLRVTDGTVSGTSTIPVEGGNNENIILLIKRCGTRLFVCAKFIESIGFEIYVLDDPASINNISMNDFAIYPNPADDFINLKFANRQPGRTPVFVSDVSGRCITDETLPEGSTECRISVGKLSAGVYFLRAGDVSRKFIKM